jgi:drug/metabolite transporter (DMT)-like permease
MISLILATLCSASIAILFKISAEKQLNGQIVTVVNYLTAAIVSLFMILSKQNDRVMHIESGDFRTAVLLGVMTGFLFLASFIMYQKSVRKNGASLSGMFAKLGILVPMLVSIIVWSERPSAVQSFGIVFALLAVAIVNMKSRGESRDSRSILLLFALFATGGVAEFLNKVFQKSASMDYKPIFLFVVFSTALAISAFLLFRSGHKRELVRASLIMGFFVGVPNLFSSFFLLEALDVFPAAIVFPTYSAGSILIITLVSAFLLKEKLENKDRMAIGLTALGLILMNI